MAFFTLWRSFIRWIAPHTSTPCVTVRNSELQCRVKRSHQWTLPWSWSNRTRNTISHHNYFFLYILNVIPPPTLGVSQTVSFFSNYPSTLSHYLSFISSVLLFLPIYYPIIWKPQYVLKQRGLCIPTACTFLLKLPVKWYVYKPTRCTKFLWLDFIFY